MPNGKEYPSVTDFVHCVLDVLGSIHSMSLYVLNVL